MPARGGSKRIKRKNLRLLNGRPLLSYVLETAQKSRFIDDIIVSTDDLAIAEYVTNIWDVMLRKRPSELASDDVPLDPVVYDAVLQAEQQNGYEYDIVITLQPTSPTLMNTTLDQAIEEFIHNSYDTSIAAVEDSHLGWRATDRGPVPLYEQRVNRQWLPITYRETGAFVISKRRVVTMKSRFGNKIAIFPISREEAVDIDEEVDWVFAKTLLNQLSIAFIVRGNQHIGMGHVYRVITLADAFLGNHIHFLAYDSDDKTIDFIRQHGYAVINCPNKQTLLRHLTDSRLDLVVNDILDTGEEYISDLHAMGCFVVNFEDLGKGSLQADLVFNALYEFSSPPPNHRFGSKYVCLGEDFLLLPPAPFRDPASTLLVTFGGVDENNLTVRVCNILPQLFNNTTLERAVVVLGPGYVHQRELVSCMENLSDKEKAKIEVLKSVNNMAQLMREADVAVTSNGRTVYELAAMGIPGVTIAQNDRETLHLFSRYSEGFRYLGIACTVEEKDIFENVESIVLNKDVRAKMVESLFNINLRAGLNRVQREIVDKYWRWKDEKNSHWAAHADKGRDF